MCYGYFSNDKLLMEQGTLEENNPYDVFIMHSLLEHVKALVKVDPGRLRAALRLVRINPALRKVFVPHPLCCGLLLTVWTVRWL
jgi:hypothetical protein